MPFPMVLMLGNNMGLPTVQLYSDFHVYLESKKGEACNYISSLLHQSQNMVFDFDTEVTKRSIWGSKKLFSKFTYKLMVIASSRNAISQNEGNLFLYFIKEK